MVSEAYELDRPAGPSAGRRWVHQELVPALIRGMAPVEAVLYRVSDRSKHHPAQALLAALACGYLLRLAAGPARRPRGSARA